MVKQIVWTLKAKNELKEILHYWIWRNKSNTFSIKLNHLIEKQLHLAAKFPEIGRKTDIENVRVKFIHKYLLYYQVTNEILYVLTIRHGSKNPQTLKVV